jgi:hypothetical protein
LSKKRKADSGEDETSLHSPKRPRIEKESSLPHEEVLAPPPEDPDDEDIFFPAVENIEREPPLPEPEPEPVITPSPMEAALRVIREQTEDLLNGFFHFEAQPIQDLLECVPAANEQQRLEIQSTLEEWAQSALPALRAEYFDLRNLCEILKSYNKEEVEIEKLCELRARIAFFNREVEELSSLFKQPNKLPPEILQSGDPIVLFSEKIGRAKKDLDLSTLLPIDPELVRKALVEHPIRTATTAIVTYSAATRAIGPLIESLPEDDEEAIKARAWLTQFYTQWQSDQLLEKDLMHALPPLYRNIATCQDVAMSIQLLDDAVAKEREVQALLSKEGSEGAFPHLTQWDIGEGESSGERIASVLQQVFFRLTNDANILLKQKEPPDSENWVRIHQHIAAAKRLCTEDLCDEKLPPSFNEASRNFLKKLEESSIRSYLDTTGEKSTPTSKAKPTSEKNPATLSEQLPASLYGADARIIAFYNTSDSDKSSERKRTLAQAQKRRNKLVGRKENFWNSILVSFRPETTIKNENKAFDKKLETAREEAGSYKEDSWWKFTLHPIEARRQAQKASEKVKLLESVAAKLAEWKTGSERSFIIAVGEEEIDAYIESLQKEAAEWNLVITKKSETEISVALPKEP